MLTIELYNVWAPRAIAALSGVIGVAVFLYGVLLFSAMAHAAGATTARAQIRDLTGQISTLESRYLSLTKAISPERAVAMGFVKATEVTDVYAQSSTLTLAAPSVAVR